MAQHFNDTTGVLYLDKVTPVIQALFGGFRLNKIPAGDGQAYIASISQDSDSSWDAVEADLQHLIEDLCLELPEPDGETLVMAQYLDTLAVHFNAEDDQDLCDLLDQHDFENSADLQALFVIAKAFDDGHGLRAIKAHSAYYCDSPRLWEFGGEGFYEGRHFSQMSESKATTDFAQSVDTALTSQEVQQAADLFSREFRSMLLGIRDDKVREEVRALIALA